MNQTLWVFSLTNYRLLMKCALKLFKVLSLDFSPNISKILNMDSTSKFPLLNSPIKVGDVELPNRIAMAALTRCRSDPATNIAAELHLEYFTQRANAGFILTECSPVSDRSLSFPGNAGIYNDEQAEGWRKVVESVHQAGGRIYMQIWHSGSASHSALQQGREIWSASAVAKRGNNPFTQTPQEVAHELTVEEIKLVVQQFREGAQRAKKAGFDGLELHGAHGYLVDQFFQQSSNKRTDDYGGSVENRARFALEVIDALLEVYPASRLGIKVTPIGRYNDMYSPDPVELYTYLFAELDKRGIAFVELKNDDDPDTYGDYGYPASKAQIADIYQTFRPLFKGLIVGNLLTLEAAEQLIKDGLIDLATFGRLYIANPDLALRVKNGHPVSQAWIPKLFYAGGAQGYTDYKTYEQSLVQAQEQPPVQATE